MEKKRKEINEVKENIYASFLSVFVLGASIVSLLAKIIFNNVIDDVMIFTIVISVIVYIIFYIIIKIRIERNEGDINNDAFILKIKKISNITNWIAYPVLVCDIIYGICSKG